jgi:hypothetical protein
LRMLILLIIQLSSHRSVLTLLWGEFFMQRVARALIILSALFVFTATVKSAYADSFSVSWSGAYGPGSGTFTATDEGSGMFLITSISGTQNGTGITLLPPSPSLSSFFGNDNILIPAGTNLLDTSGFAFNDGTDDFNIYYNGAGSYSECSSTAACVSAADGSKLESFTVTPNAAVPEPSSTVLLSLSSGLMVFIGCFGRKRLHRLAA